MATPTLIAFMSALAVLLCYLGILRQRQQLPDIVQSDNLIRSLDTKLKRAGIVTVSAPAVFFAGVTTMMVTFFICLFAFRNIAIAVLLTAVLPLFLSLDLDRRARKYQDRLTGVLVPFLRKITSQVRTGQNPTKAFASAAQEDKLLRWVLRDQLANLQMQAPFQDVLRDTLKVMPLRPWVQFVRSMESFSRSGGELAEILESNVDRIQSQLLLRKKLMGDVATYRGQQIIILGFAVAIPMMLYVMGKDLFGTIFTHPVGILGCIIAAGMDCFALWMTNRAIRDVETKLES
jgi:Flp pilus assembly protein TadB